MSWKRLPSEAAVRRKPLLSSCRSSRGLVSWLLALHPSSFRTEESDVFSFHFAPTKCSACEERNLSSYFLSGDVETGKIILRDFINATVGFTKLSDVTNRSPKSLMRMLGPRGNPQARNLFEIVAYLQRAEGVRFEVRPTRAASRKKHGLPFRRRRRAAVNSR